MKTAWNINYVARTKNMKNLTEQQQLIVLLFEKPNLSKDEERELSLLLKSERARERAKLAEMEAIQLICTRKDSERKAINNRLMQLGVLVEISGQSKRTPAEVVGCLISNSNANAETWRAWEAIGEKVFQNHNKPVDA